MSNQDLSHLSFELAYRIASKIADNLTQINARQNSTADQYSDNINYLEGLVYEEILDYKKSLLELPSRPPITEGKIRGNIHSNHNLSPQPPAPRPMRPSKVIKEG